MSEIQTIIFDAGGVYMEGSMIDFVNAAYRLVGIEKTFSADEQIVFDADYNRGAIDEETCFRRFFGQISKEQMDGVKNLWMHTWAPTAGMKELVASLKPNYRIAMLSNSDRLNSEAYAARGWYDPFDPLILSHEVGFLKPDPEIYDLTIKKIGAPASSCLFIDDQPKCLIPAAELGMDVILFKDFDQLKTELSTRGIRW